MSSQGSQVMNRRGQSGAQDPRRFFCLYLSCQQTGFQLGVTSPDQEWTFTGPNPHPCYPYCLYYPWIHLHSNPQAVIPRHRDPGRQQISIYKHDVTPSSEMLVLKAPVWFSCTWFSVLVWPNPLLKTVWSWASGGPDRRATAYSRVFSNTFLISKLANTTRVKIVKGKVKMEDNFWILVSA